MKFRLKFLERNDERLVLYIFSKNILLVMPNMLATVKKVTAISYYSPDFTL